MIRDASPRQREFDRQPLIGGPDAPAPSWLDAIAATGCFLTFCAGLYVVGAVWS